MNTFLSDDLCFIHLFHCKILTIFLHVNTPNFSETSFSYNVVKLKMITTNLYIFWLWFIFVLDNNFVLFLILPS